MTLTEGFAKDEIFIDFGAEIIYGDDQAYDSYPAHFPTVEFELMATNGLVQIADRIRKDAGFKPMHPMDEYTDDTCDNDGWYDFYIGINGYAENNMDSCINFIVVNSDSEDNEEMYSIDLGPDEQLALYNRLDEQCRQHLGKSCAELLDEAEERMYDLAMYYLRDDLRNNIVIDPQRWAPLDGLNGVQIKLKPNEILNQVAEEVVRLEFPDMKKPLMDISDSEEDPNRRFDFYMTISYDKENGYHVEDRIDFFFVEDGVPQNDAVYSINIKNYRAKHLYYYINIQLIDHFGLSADEIIDAVMKAGEETGQKRKGETEEDKT